MRPKYPLSASPPFCQPAHPPPVQLSNPQDVLPGDAAQKQERNWAPSADGELGLKIEEEQVDVAPRTIKDGFVFVISIDEEFNSTMVDLSQHFARNIMVFSRHSTPLLVINKEDNICTRFETWATTKLTIIIALLSIAVQVLLQTNLSTPVMCCLLIVVVFAFPYLLLRGPQQYKNYVCVIYASRLCFGITTAAMALAIALQAWHLTKSSSTSS